MLSLTTSMILSATLASTGCSEAPGSASEGDTQPVAEVRDDGGLITKLKVTSTTGELAPSYMTHHPIRVSMTIKPTADFHSHIIHVGLVEKHSKEAGHDAARTCLLGAFEAISRRASS